MRLAAFIRQRGGDYFPFSSCSLFWSAHCQQWWGHLTAFQQPA